MSERRLFETICRITPAAPTDLDDLVYALRPRPARTGHEVFPAFEPPPQDAPQNPPEGARVTIVVRVQAPLDDPADYAMRLAALALERDAEIVILSALDYCGLERFGFRCERIVPEGGAITPERLADLRAFWSLDLVL